MVATPRENKDKTKHNQILTIQSARQISILINHPPTNQNKQYVHKYIK